MIKFTLSAFVVAPLLVASINVQAFSTQGEPVPLNQQIAVADILVLAELQSVVAEHQVNLDISGEEDSLRLFLDIPIKIIETFKLSSDPNLQIFAEQEEPIIRIMKSEKSAMNDGLAFPAEPGRRVVVSLQRDTLVKEAPPAFVVLQQSYHLVEGDMLLVMHNGRTIDKLSLDAFMKLLKMDRERVEYELEIAEPAEIMNNTPSAEVLERVEE